MIHATTGLVAILGTPIAQVQSPTNFNRWFQAQGLDLAMLPVDLAPEALAGFIASLRGWNNLRGCVITVPYKQTVVPLLDDLSTRARLLGSVNVIRRETNGRLIGDNVDGEGFIKAAAAHGFDAKGKHAVVLGAGGAGAAIAYSLAEAGIATLDLADPTPGRAEALARVLRTAFPALTVRERVAPLAGYDLLVNASPIGMGDAGELPLPDDQLAQLLSHTHVADVVTKPVQTPLLTLAQARGCSVQTGPQMSLAQMPALGFFMGVMPESL